MPRSPVFAPRSNPTRCEAPSGWPRGACARSRAVSTRRCILRNGTTPLATRPTRCTSALTWSSRAVWRPGGQAVGVVLGLLTARPPDRLTAQSAPTSDTIIVVNRNVFDLQEADAPSFIARLANRLHARTRAAVIRGTLLVNPGDRYDSARVAESERALRNLSVFSRVRIDTTRPEGRPPPRLAPTERRSLAIQGAAASERVLVFRDGVLDPAVEKMDTTGRTVFLEHHVLRFGAVAGFAAHATTRSYLRVWLAGQWRREDFAPDTTRAVPRSAFGTLGVGLDAGHVGFQVLERFNSYARREDVDISQLLHVGLWAAPGAWGYA